MRTVIDTVATLFTGAVWLILKTFAPEFDISFITSDKTPAVSVSFASIVTELSPIASPDSKTASLYL